MPVAALAQVVQALPVREDPDLLIGPETLSDAGVYRVAPDLAMVQSLDFFPPVVDDPETYGRIAAANALSDVYAHGAQPRTAMNIVCFPDNEAPVEILGAMLAGGAERVHAAGAVVVGGHTVRDPGIQYGLSVTGTVDPAVLMSNAGARPGDVLVLTKALGTGFITTALRREACPPDALDAAVARMTALNDVASAAAVEVGARGATDITGYGFGGHALELAHASEVTVEINVGALPVIPGAEELADGTFHSRANKTNQAHVQAHVDGSVDDPRSAFLWDPQTSGGLLVAVGADRADEFVARCVDGGAGDAAVIGRVLERGPAAIVLRS